MARGVAGGSVFLEGGSRLRAGPLSPPCAGRGTRLGRDPPWVSAPAPSLACCFAWAAGVPSPEVGAVDTRTLQKPRPGQRPVGRGARGSHSEGPGSRAKLVGRDEGAFRGSLRTRAHPAGSWWPHLRGVVRTEDRWSERSRAGGTGGSAEWPPCPLEPWVGPHPPTGLRDRGPSPPTPFPPARGPCTRA